MPTTALVSTPALSLNEALTIVIALVSAVVSAGSALLTLLTYNAAKSALAHQMLFDLEQIYRSAEMHSAIQTLWDFRGSFPSRDEFLEKYVQVRTIERGRVLTLPLPQRVDSIQSTLDYQRRLVSHFYFMVGSLLQSRVMSRDIVFRSWSPQALRIIPEILVPIETQLRHEIYGPSARPLDNSDPRVYLYNESVRPRHPVRDNLLLLVLAVLVLSILVICSAGPFLNLLSSLLSAVITTNSGPYP